MKKISYTGYRFPPEIIQRAARFVGEKWHCDIGEM
jgi:hypothetical protein